VILTSAGDIVRYGLMVGLLCIAETPAGAQSSAPAAMADYAAGRALLDSAVKATGDSVALVRLRGLETAFCARAVEIGQSARPDAAYDTIVAAGMRRYDLAARRYAQTWFTEFRGGLPLALREVVTDSTATSIDLRGGVVMSVAPGGISASLRRVEDNAPYAPLAILQRARRNAPSIRIVRPSLGNRSEDAIVFVDNGQLTTLHFDRRTHLLSRMDLLFDNWAFGLTPFQMLFSDYRRKSGIALATHIVTRFAGSLQTDAVFRDLAVAQPPPDAFSVPVDSARTVPVGGALQVSIDSVAPHVFVIRDGQTAPPNFGYNPPFAYVRLLVELRDRLLMIDAAGSSSTQQAVMAKVRAMFPANQVGLLAFTHYHSDHFGGLRPYIAAGATLLTTPGNRGLIERVSRVLHPTEAPAMYGSGRPRPRIEVFTGVRVVLDSDAPVELHQIGGGHADEMVVAWLPRQGVLYATDVFGILPARGRPEGTYPAEQDLARYARRHGWKVRTIVAGHGPVSSGAALDSVLDVRPAPGRPLGLPACGSP
jgi:glyoxylase-like metal-dependent hydrolase (beta-lactamase superfamily II)